MRICALVQGWYGHRIVLNLKKWIPSDWELEVYEFLRNLPILIEEPKDFLPKKISRCDLILSLGEQPAIASLLPDLVKLTGAKAVIVPIDNSEWVPPGVRTQVSKELKKLGAASAFPKPFCSMRPNSGNELIDAFAKIFGKPELKIHVKNDLVERVGVIRGSPCGGTHFVAEKLVGVKRSEASTKASLFLQLYPCLASSKKDIEYDDMLIHVSAHIMKGAVEEALPPSPRK